MWGQFIVKTMAGLTQVTSSATERSYQLVTGLSSYSRTYVSCCKIEAKRHVRGYRTQMHCQRVLGYWCWLSWYWCMLLGCHQQLRRRHHLLALMLIRVNQKIRHCFQKGARCFQAMRRCFLKGSRCFQKRGHCFQMIPMHIHFHWHMSGDLHSDDKYCIWLMSIL